MSWPSPATSLTRGFGKYWAWRRPLAGCPALLALAGFGLWFFGPKPFLLLTLLAPPAVAAALPDGRRSREKDTGDASVDQTVGALGGSRRQPGPYDVEHLPARGEHAQGTPGPAIDHGRSIDEDLEFAVATANHLDLDSQLAAQPGRHPGGIQPGDSVGTIPNSDPTHD